ncbi:MAG: hypothetical protein ACLVK8_04540 [Ruminococcus sp.]
MQRDDRQWCGVFGLFPTRAAAEQACTALKKLVPFAEVCHTL